MEAELQLQAGEGVQRIKSAALFSSLEDLQ